MAGQVIMQGFAGFRIPLWLRRLVTMVPSFAIVALGVDATRAPGGAQPRAADPDDRAPDLDANAATSWVVTSTVASPQWRR